MKIVFSSTDEQEQEIETILFNLRSTILPSYILSQDLDKYNEMGLLQFSNYSNKYNGTLREAYQLMTALQTVATIIDYVSKSVECQQYEDLFNRNAQIINNFGLFFPFTLQCFRNRIPANGYVFTFAEAENQIIC
ncbi:DUF5365 family protein [Bacillus massiliigorillae]|uniref:DUF5365 family protein n=1 Tax=Bacillus massiliigorillae TaxID=1243664 RepID=UPI0005A7F894|nr:DUF5365 family protein [Bacillus massiliigorillae]